MSRRVARRGIGRAVRAIACARLVEDDVDHAQEHFARRLCVAADPPLDFVLGHTQHLGELVAPPKQLHGTQQRAAIYMDAMRGQVAHGLSRLSCFPAS